jgi:DNA-binding CsgD family transcriptional regulator
VSEPRFCTDRELLRRLYLDEMKTGKEIARLLGFSPALVYRRLSEFGLTRTKRQSCRLAKSGTLLDERLIADLYRKGCSTNDLGRRFGMSPNTVLLVLREQEVQIRTKSEASTLRRPTKKRRSPHPRTLLGTDKCAICGVGERLEQHHVNGLHDDNRPENVLPLCWEHHLFIEYLVAKALHGIRSREGVVVA